MKSQVIAVEFILNLLIAFVLLGYAYFWSSGIFEKTMDRIKINRAEKIIYELDERIQRIGKIGGKDFMDFQFDGTFEVKRNSTSELFNKIELKTKISSFSTTPWVYLNSYKRDKFVSEPMNTFSIIRKRNYGNKVFFQLFYRVLIQGNEGTTIVIEPKFNWICSGRCEITIEKVGERDIEFEGKTIHASVVRLDIK